MNSRALIGPVVGVGLASLCAPIAHADTVFAGSTRMLFAGPTGEVGGTLNSSIVNAAATGGVSTFSHGTPAAGSTQNVLSFNGADLFSALNDGEFVLGDLNYLNGRTQVGSAATAIEANLEVTFTSPIGINPPNTTFVFQWQFTLTPNTTGDPVADGDILSVVNTTASQTFIVGSEVFTLEILGFRSPNSGGPLTSSWLLPEDRAIDGVLVGRFTTNLIPLPSAAALGLASFSILAVRRRR